MARRTAPARATRVRLADRCACRCRCTLVCLAMIAAIIVLTGSQGLVLALVELIAKLFGLEKDAASGAPLLSAAHEDCCLTWRCLRSLAATLRGHAGR